MTPEVYKMIKADLKAGKLEGKLAEVARHKVAEFEKNTAAAKVE